jgi:GT2 family glycosyltransferase/glycosyltransferase involved in cell wall biosynthesis
MAGHGGSKRPWRCATYWIDDVNSSIRLDTNALAELGTLAARRERGNPEHPIWISLGPGNPGVELGYRCAAEVGVWLAALMFEGGRSEATLGPANDENAPPEALNIWDAASAAVEWACKERARVAARSRAVATSASAADLVAERDAAREAQSMAEARAARLTSERDSAVAARESLQSMLTHLIEERAYLGVHLTRAYQRPWRPLKFALKYWLLSMLSAGSRPISGRTSVRFARSAEKRSPTRFDRFLFAEHPEAAENSPAHFVEYGRSRGGPTHSTVRFADYLPYTGTLFQPPSGIAVDIVIPVYRGLEETRRCIETVLADNDRPQGRILVIDDCSPEPELSAWLRSVAADGRIELLRNERNLGFVASVNRGLRQGGRNDIVLLNSDTEVPSGWLPRLMAHAYVDPLVGSVTPFSNNATICSYPTVSGGSLPSGYSVQEIDDACRRGNGIRAVRIPTAVGFCMYIRRDCLDEVGLFDEKTFGRGYGEENDFCMRASAMGWRHVLACNTFIYHAGEVSFGNNSPERGIGWDTLVTKYPQYPGLVSQYVKNKPTDSMIFATTVALFAASHRPTILMVSHSIGGGTARHIDDVVKSVTGMANIFLLSSRAGVLELSVPTLPRHPLLELPDTRTGDLITLLKLAGVSRVHIHHLHGFNVDVRALIDRLEVPFDVTIHDYFSICPRINLLSKPNGIYCGEPTVAECNSCIAQGPTNGASDIITWRLKHQWLLTEADRVICPSNDVRQRLSRFVNDSNLVVVPHEPVLDSAWPMSIPDLARGRPIRIAVLGVLAAHKGRAAFEACVRESDPALFSFALIGMTDTPFSNDVADRVLVTGAYEEGLLSSLISELKPHVLWFPQTCPETYSYTLSAAIQSGLPIVASRIGAFAERLAGRPWTWCIDDPSCPATEWLGMFGAVAASLATGSGPAPASPRKIHGAFYPVTYLKPHPNARPKTASNLLDLRSPNHLTVLILPDRLQDGRVSPCGYIRLVQPLTHIAASNRQVLLHEVDLTAAFHRIADVLICQRHSVSSIELANQLIDHCRANAMRLVYDLDDDLISDAPEHPENENLQAKAPVVVRLVLAADVVCVSTGELGKRLSSIRSDWIVIPNYLDERLWTNGGGRKREDGDKTIRLLYTGTVTHDLDYEFLEGVVELVQKKYRALCRFEIIGITSRKRLHPGVQRINPPSSASASYPAFASWISSQFRWDIGVAPLIETTFSGAKSSIKLIDYAALGLPVVASDVPAYRNTLGHGVHLVPNNERAWVDAISALIEDTDLRCRLGRQNRADFLRKHSLGAAQGAWLGALQMAAERGSYRTRSTD